MIRITERTAAYLRRIGLDPDEIAKASPDLDLLARIQWAHVTTVPYETIDIMAGIPLRFDRDSLYEKIVTRRRGGYCYELNGVLGHLLHDLGYSVTNVMGRFFPEDYEVPETVDPEDWSTPERRHRVLLIDLDGERWLVDVGVGIEAPREPLRLVDGLLQKHRMGPYRLVRHEFYGWIVWRCREDGHWFPLYSFNEHEIQADRDLEIPSYYLENSPDSMFREALMVSLKTEKGRKTIDGMTYREREGGVVVCEIKIKSTDELEEICRMYFGIERRAHCI